VDGSLLEPEFLFSRPPPEKIYEATREGSGAWVSGWISAAVEVLAVCLKLCLLIQNHGIHDEAAIRTPQKQNPARIPNPGSVQYYQYY
jgi:hypothetical protein